MSGGDGLNITNDSTPQMTIGHYRDGSGSYLGHWDGKISQVLLYDRTLSDSEIENLYDEDGENCGNASSQGCGDSTPDQTGKVLEYIAAYQGNNNNGCATQENPNGVCDYSALYNQPELYISSYYIGKESLVTGVTTPTNALDGSIDEFATFTVALSDDEIYNAYQRGAETFALVGTVAYDDADTIGEFT